MLLFIVSRFASMTICKVNGQSFSHSVSVVRCTCANSRGMRKGAYRVTWNNGGLEDRPVSLAYIDNRSSKLYHCQI